MAFGEVHHIKNSLDKLKGISTRKDKQKEEEERKGYDKQEEEED